MLFSLLQTVEPWLGNATSRLFREACPRGSPSPLIGIRYMFKTIADLPFMSPIRGALRVQRPAIYLCLILAVAAIVSAYKFRTESLFACPATLYSPDRYIAYCAGARYADYEHGAFEFRLEPAALDYAKNADVMFLGNSRLQKAFSTAATADWFYAASAHYYLLGFTYYENVVFAEALLHQIRPRASVYVINLDDFFERQETPPAKTVLRDPDAPSKYEIKRRWQHIHEPICKTLPVLCGSKLVYFRSRETGAYTQPISRPKVAAVSYDESVDQSVVDNNAAVAIDFLSHLPVGRKCVILTLVPYQGTKIGNANAIAKALDMDLIVPQGLAGLETSDGFHLDHPSAERWSQAFFQAASSRINACIEAQRVSNR
jgi:hypothetical protein